LYKPFKSGILKKIDGGIPMKSLKFLQVHHYHKNKV